MRNTLNKALVGALILTTVATSTAVPAYAEGISSSSIIDNRATVTANYEILLENAIYNARETIKILREKLDSGIFNSSLFTKLAKQLNELDRAITLSGKAAPSEVLDIIKQAEGLTQDLKGMPSTNDTATKVNTSIIMLKSTMDDVGTIVLEKRETVKLTDIAGHWGRSNIVYLVSKGGIAGFTENGEQVFKPNNTITKCEFLKIALYSATPNATRTASDGTHWASGVFVDAENLHILKPGEMSKDEWNKPITRYEMTMIMTRISTEILKENEVATDGISGIMEDYQDVQQESYYTSYVEQAFMKGLIAGTNSAGKFNGAANGTRAEAATMVVRLIDASSRVKAEINKKIVPYGHSVATQEVIDKCADNSIKWMKVFESPENWEDRETIIKDIKENLRISLPAYWVWREPTTLRWDDVTRDKAMIGDTFIKPDGTKVVLKVGPSFVLGEGQGVATELGRVDNTGDIPQVVADGFGPSDNYFGSQPGDVYKINPNTGEGHWDGVEWSKIYNYTKPTYEGKKDGELSKDKNWEWSFIAGGDWYFAVR